jgi:hypothetical protein
MWAHYADGHRGFCLEFDAERDPFVKAEPVAYRESVPEVNLVDMLDGKSTTPDALDVMLRTKFTCWQYEQEWRITYDQAGTAYNYPFDALTSVYLGASMPSGQRDVIGQLLLGSPVQLYQMKQGSGGFTVEPEPVNYIPYQNRGDAPEQLAESQETEQTPHTTHH